jgi:cytidylate kinase
VGKVILMGRGGVSITRDLASGVHIRLVAPRDTRVQRTMGNLGISEKEAARWVDDQDRSRARMVKSRFKQNIDDPLLYDAVWNTDTVPLDAIARYVTEMVRGK